MEKIRQIKQLIAEINRLHLNFSNDYFEIGKNEKVNLAKSITYLPAAHVYKYRQTLEECINDYLKEAKINISFYFRVKTHKSIEEKLTRFTNRPDRFPVSSWMNDIFGARLILTDIEIEVVMDLLDKWEKELNLENWYLREREGCKWVFVYFNNQSNFYYPWELQIWDVNDLHTNIKIEAKAKRRSV